MVQNDESEYASHSCRARYRGAFTLFFKRSLVSRVWTDASAFQKENKDKRSLVRLLNNHKLAFFWLLTIPDSSI